MKKAYIWISTDILEELLKLPEGVRIGGILSSDIRQGQIGVIITGKELPVDGETMSELTPVYEGKAWGDFRFLEWAGAPG